MAWYKTGTVSVTNGETSITGTGTNFATNARVGDGFRGPDGEWYEVTNIASETTLGIYPAFQGVTVSNSPNYMIAPLQGYNKESADRLRAITDSFTVVTSVAGRTGDVVLDKYDVGLDLVDNTADSTKPVSAPQQTALNLKIDKTSIVDDLTSTDATKVLSANQGKVLNDIKVNVSDIVDSLVSTDTAKPLSANQGKVLRDSTYTKQESDTTITNLALKSASKADILGVVSQSGGVPTGAIIERGSNANGNYTKYADGTMMCWGNTPGLDQTTTSQAYSVGVTLPSTFIDTNFKVMVNLNSVNVTNVFEGYGRAGSGTTSTFALIQYWNYVQTYTYTYIAIGRWY